MSREIDFLSDRYAKILELADNVDSNLVDRILRYSQSLEEKAINFILQEQSFHRTTRDNSSFLYHQVSDNKLDLELAEGMDNKFVLRKLFMKPLNVETMKCFNSNNLENRTIRLIHFTASNMPAEPELKMHVEQGKDGTYKYKGLETNGVICFEYQMDLTYIDGRYILSSTKLISNCEQYTKEIEMSEMDLVDYVSPIGPMERKIQPQDLSNENNSPNRLIKQLSDEELKNLLDGLDKLFGQD